MTANERILQQPQTNEYGDRRRGAGRPRGSTDPIGVEVNRLFQDAARADRLTESENETIMLKAISIDLNRGLGRPTLETNAYSEAIHNATHRTNFRDKRGDAPDSLFDETDFD